MVRRPFVCRPWLAVQLLVAVYTRMLLYHELLPVARVHINSIVRCYASSLGPVVSERGICDSHLCLRVTQHAVYQNRSITGSRSAVRSSRAQRHFPGISTTWTLGVTSVGSGPPLLPAVEYRLPWYRESKVSGRDSSNCLGS